MSTITGESFQSTHSSVGRRIWSRTPSWLKAMLRNPLSVTGMSLVVLFALIAIFAPLLAPPAYPTAPFIIPQDGFEAQPQPPSPAHIFGTTSGQYDLYYGVVWGTRTAFEVGLIVTFFSSIIGTIAGAIAAFTGGALDNVVQRVVEMFLAFPFLLAALILATVLGPKLRNGILTGMIALVTFGWPSYARLIRGNILSIRERDYVVASKALGAPSMRNLFFHVLPNAISSTLVVASLDVGANVLTFAALSFLGVGASLGYADWGQLLSFARNWIPSLATYWYIVVFPGAALLLFSLSWNLIGDAFRDAIDPTMRGQRGGS